MCIFSSNIVVKSTKVLAAQLHNDNRLLAYQNSVVSKTDNVMMLPIPCSYEGVVFLDTRPFANFLEDIALKIARKEVEGTRGMLDVPKGFDRVGQYRYKLVPEEALEYELKELNQPVYPWLNELLSKYDGWSWLLCIIDAGAEMKNQPLLIEYVSIIDELYFPMMDIHGNDGIQPTAHRDHIVIAGHKNNKNPIAFAREYPEFPYQDLNFVGGTLKGNQPNGDIFMSPVYETGVYLMDSLRHIPEPEKVNWKARWK